MHDSEIISLYWERDELAIDKTSEKYGSYCNRISMNILRSEEDAQECVNDTYLHAWNAIPPNQPSILRIWLGKITRNLSLDRYKREHAQKRGGDEVSLLLDELEDCLPGNNFVEQWEERELGLQLDTFLRLQKAQPRMIFIRRYYFAETISEIANRFGMKENAVKSALFRTRNALKTFLEKEGIAI